jgi:2-methylcitrate dehydratase PrpD
MTAGRFPLEGPRGILAVTVDRYDLDKITKDWGTSFELRDNTYKPFPSGIVIQPAIDACIQLREKHRLTADQIAGVELRVAPLVKDLCNKRELNTGLEGKFSIYHAAAIGLARGKGGLAEFTDDAINDPVLRRLRDATNAVEDTTVGEDGVVVTVRLTDGSTIGMTLHGSLGNLERPLSDAQLEAKFREQAGVLAPSQVDAAIAACFALESLDDTSSLIAHCIPRKL